MAYDFNQMFQRKGVQGVPGGRKPIGPPMPAQTLPPSPGASNGGQQILGPPVQVGGSGTNGQGGGIPGYTPGAVPPPMPPGQQGKPAPGDLRQGGGFGGFQNQGQITGALGKSAVDSGKPPYYGDVRDYLPGGVYYIPGADPNIDAKLKEQYPGWEPGQPLPGGGAPGGPQMPGGHPGYTLPGGGAPGQFYPPGSGPIYGGGGQPGRVTGGPAQVPGGGYMPYGPGGGGGMKPYQPYFNPGNGGGIGPGQWNPMMNYKVYPQG